MPCGTRVECRRASSGQRAQTSKPLSMTKDIMDSAPEIDRPRDRIPSREQRPPFLSNPKTMKISQPLYLRAAKVGGSPAHVNDKLRVGIVHDCEL